MADASVTAIDGRAVVRVGGAELFDAYVGQAIVAADGATTSQGAAELAAATALAASRYYATRAAGEAASAVDQLFSTDDGAGNVIYYRRSSVGSAEIGRAVTPSSLFASTGAELVNSKRRGSRTHLRSVMDRLDDTAHLFDFVPPIQHAAIIAGTSSYVINEDLQAAINAESEIMLPAGRMRIDAISGVAWRTGTTLTGSGCRDTVFHAIPGGGTLDELAAYKRGSIFHREFNPDGLNDYLAFVHMSDLAIILDHPTGSITATAMQVGVDLRNVTRSNIERVFVGNITPVGFQIQKPQTGAYDVQGYGYVIGTTNGASYAGGEVNTLRNCFAWGTYKGMVQDDLVLSPFSAAHATTIDCCDIQHGHHLLVQESVYGARSRWLNNVVQSVVKQPGDQSDSFLYRIEGKNNVMRDNYAEAGSGANFLLYLGTGSSANNVSLGHCTSTVPTPVVTDNGRRNVVDHFADSGSIAGGQDSEGPLVELYDGAFKNPWAKFAGDTAALEAGQGITVVRNGVGDYTLTFTRPFRSDDYSIAISLDTNASANGGSFSVVSHTASNLRLQCWAGIGNISSTIDPRRVWVRLAQ